MTTEKQLAANRENARLSTGPRTDAGKAASSTNAVKHGLSGHGLVILPGQQEKFSELQAGLRGSLLPNGPLQELIFRRALTSSWNLHRCEEAEADSYRMMGQPGLDPMVGRDHEAICRVRRYAREAENSLYKAMRELGKLQEEAKSRNEVIESAKAAEEVVEAEAPLSEVCRSRPVMKSATRPHGNEKVEFIDRKRQSDASDNRNKAVPGDPVMPAASRAAA